MERAYYVVGQGAVRDALVAKEAEVAGQRKEIFKALRQAALATGCNPEVCMVERNACVGLVFDRGKPPSRLCRWRKVGRDTYWPVASTKAGKMVAAVFSFAKPADLEDALPFAVEACLKVGDDFFVTKTYDEMLADEPDFPGEAKGHLARIKPSAFQQALNRHNGHVMVASVGEAKPFFDQMKDNSPVPSTNEAGEK